jgi:hypothetical protein
MQAEPLQLLGTDSYGCCCSAGETGLGPRLDKWTTDDTYRYAECDLSLRYCSATQTCSTTVTRCTPEVCQFEIMDSPKNLTFSKHLKDVVAEIPLQSPCVGTSVEHTDRLSGLRSADRATISNYER